MQPKRIYFVKFNLDEFSASLAEYEEDTHALGLWLRGYKLGAYGLPIRPDAEPARAKGHAFGMKANQEAAEYAKSRSDNGKHGGRPKKKKPYGKHMESVCKPHEKHTANHTESIPKANEQPATSNEQPPDSNEQRQDNIEQTSNDGWRAADDLERLKGMCMKSNARANEIHFELDAILNEYGHKRTFEAAKQVPYKSRWPSEIRKEIETASKQSNPSPIQIPRDPWAVKADIILARFTEHEIITFLGMPRPPPDLRRHLIEGPRSIDRIITGMMNGQCP